MIKMGHRVLPPTFPGMKSLTKRGMKLADRLEDHCREIIEAHPLTSGKILFNSKSRKKWISSLKEEGWKIDSKIEEHEIDASIAAVTGLLYKNGNSKVIRGEEGEIIIPDDHLKAS